VVRIRLKRMGRRNRAFFRICAMDSRAPRDGKSIEDLGIYDPLAKEPDRWLVVKRDRVAYWLSVGAQPTEKVRVLLQKAGVTFPEKSRRRKRRPQAQEPSQAPAP
jgi:small subunit ribosomal protein S16